MENKLRRCVLKLVSVRMEWILPPPSMVVARSYLWWPWSSSQMEAGRDPTTAKFEGRQQVHLILTKVVFACKILRS